MPEKKKDVQDLSINQIQDKLAQIEIDKKELDSALQRRRSSERADFANEIRDKITERGYSVDEVFALLNKGRRKASSTRRSAEYARYVDPDNPEHSYSRGPLPSWLQEKMTATGYDPADKAQREEFKSTHLKRVA